MSDYHFSYTEVIPDQTIVEKWREITLNTGGRQSTLQDIKVAERSNGYCYADSTKSCTRNRFIYWRISHDVLELTEQSLDTNLSDNSIRYKFVDTPILDGITIHETHTNVIILVPTVCSVHRIIFPHPTKSRQGDYYGFHPDFVLPSIFADASAAQAKNPASFHIITNPSGAGSHLPHCSTSWYSAAKNEAYFLFAYPTGEVLLIKYNEFGGCECIELKSESIVPRFLYGLAEKFRSRSSDGNVVVSMVLHTIGLETYAFTLSKSGHLRVWSCSKGQCISVSDILSETVSGQNLSHGSQNHILRKAVGGNELEFILAVVLNFSPECQFHIMQPDISGNQFKLIKISTLFSPGVDLVDFSLTSSRIWSVWRGEDGDCSVYSATLATNSDKGSHWVPIPLEPIPDPSELKADSNLDPKETYMQYIFHPGRFSLNIISKALSIYTKSSVISDISLSANILKQQVNIAVENDIQQELQQSEVTDDDYLDCTQWCWARFYSCCIQYHVTGLRPLGILLLPSVSGAILLKKSTYSFLRPLDTLEHLYLCNDYITRNELVLHPQLGISYEETDDLIELIGVLIYLDQQLNESFKQTFENELGQLRAPDVVMDDLITNVVVDCEEEFTYLIIQKLQSCRDIYNSMHKLLELLTVQQLVNDNDDKSSPKPTSIDHLFASQLGISFVTQCLKQQAHVRYSICRNLLALQHIILHHNDENFTFFEGVRSICIPDTVLLTRIYFNIVWLTGLPIQTNVALEQSLQKLVTLKLPPVFNLKLNVNKLLMDLFVGSTGGFNAHKLMSQRDVDEETLPFWNCSLLCYLNHLFLILWPLNGNPTFSEWLLSSGQHVWLQQYVRYLNNWCDAKSSRNFLLAASFLTSSEHHKSFDLFVEAVKGIDSEQFLQRHIANVARNNNNTAIRYFLKVIQLFEAYGARNFAIELANVALSMAETKNPLRATLYSIQFKHHLALNHYEDAYKALQSNPDDDRKKDNLRDLVKTLLDKKELDVLMSFTYCNLEKLFCSILFMRARAADGVNNIYYDFLYSYQMKRGIPYLRLAGAVMYEQAFRLNQWNSIEALEKQVKCYLAAVNALSLCESKHAWVLTPIEPELQEQTVLIPSLAGSNTPYKELKLVNQLEVVSLSTIKKELALALARLRLGRIDKDSVANYTTPQELVVMLATVGIFKCALELCQTYNLSSKPVFEMLTHQCINLMETEDQESWNWLTENDLHDLPIIGNTPSDVAWQLLKTFLHQYEEDHMTTIHRFICEKILILGCFVPNWLEISYKLRNPAELIKLYFLRGYLIEATNLTCEYILAVLDRGYEYFGLEMGLVPGARPFCFPVRIIERLLHRLDKENKIDVTKPLQKEHNRLQQLYFKYLEVSSRISNETTRLQSLNI
ncbi:nuclear pore complex protein Nup160 homolog [Onthophagus taurus]|uniref:nuclear pore complex protein Nup160 homolog n=1 Tax=Onthophagus taurus TaxID=166361 RepID=UPI000C20E0BC|nr:nuclear pore complex protein Nup160 homolog [Onthophagus taurus]